MNLIMKQIRRPVALSCALLIVLMLALAGCGRNGDRQGETTATQPVTEATEAPTQATEETVEVTEESTEATEEPTEETTEATEETTEPTTGSSGGNSTPGGSSGYNPGTNNDSNDDTNTPTEEKAPEAGSEGSPYIETVSQFPEEVYSVSVPAGKTVYHMVYGAEGGVLTIEDQECEAYVIYNEVTYEPDAYGIIQVPFAPKAEEETPDAQAEEETSDDLEEGEDPSEPEAEEQPVVLPQVFQLGSKSAEARSFLMTFNVPMGDAQNPEPLEAVDGIISLETSLAAGDADGYTYSFASEIGGRLILQVDAEMEAMGYEVTVTVGEVVYKLSEAEEGILSVDFTGSDTVLIHVVALADADISNPEVKVQLTFQVEDTSGTKDNPIMIPGEFPIETGEIAPNTELYYSIYGAGGMILTIEDPDAYVIIGEDTWSAVDGIVSGEVVSTNPREPVLLAVGNAGEETKSFTVNFAFKPGNMMNPAQLVLDEVNTAVISAGASDGYWFTWTAEEEGIFTLTMPEGNWMYQINNLTQSVYGDTVFSDGEDVSAIAEMEVAAGDELSILVCTYDPADPFNVPAGELAINAIFNTKAGTRDNPLWLWDLENVVEAQPNINLYLNVIMSGVDMQITGEGEFTVTYGGTSYSAEMGVVSVPNISASRYQPELLILTNNEAAAAEYTVTFIYPEGSSANPKLLELMGEYTVPVKGDGEGYFFTWIANSDGEFTVTMKSQDWVYTVHNMTQYIYGDINNSSEGAESSQTVSVVAGDELLINIGTASRQNKDLVLEFDFYDPTYGTAENPAMLYDEVNTLSLQAGSTLYANVVMSGVNMTVSSDQDFSMTYKGIDYVSENGSVTVYGLDATRWTPVQLILTNPGETAATYTVEFVAPLGTIMNPEVITEMKQYVASVVGDGAGYFYTWTAEADGVFEITMLSDDWTYVINNLTQYVYGDICSSTGGPSSQTIAVKAGDELEINVGTLSQQNKDVVMEFDAYDPAVGTQDNPLWLNSKVNTVTVRPNAPVYGKVIYSDVTMIVTGDVAVTLGGVGYPAVDGKVTVTGVKASRNMPLELVLTNSGDKKTECIVEFVPVVGSMMAPEEIGEMGTYTAKVVGDSQGYFYTWTAPADGEFTLSMLGDDWVYVIFGEVNSSAAKDPTSKTVAVTAGEILEINIGTASGKDLDVQLEFRFQEAAQLQEDVEPVFEGTYIPKTFLVTPEEIQEMGTVDLMQSYELWASKAGIYHLDAKSGPLVLVDFTDDTYVNLVELVESQELLIPVEAEDGEVSYLRCNELLEQYIACGWVVEVSEDVTHTYYPLTEDLELILKALGQEFGWFDPDSEGYLFNLDVDAEQTEEAPVLAEDSLWMFSCSYITFVMDEAAEAPESAEVTQEEQLPEVTEETLPETEEEIPEI